MFLRQCEKPSCTPIQNNKQNYYSIYLNFCILDTKLQWQMILHRAIESIPWLQSALNFFMNGKFILRVVPKYLNSSTLSKDLFCVCCNFVLHSDLENRPCTWSYQHFTSSPVSLLANTKDLSFSL
jgi:hypothetical protein